MTSRSPDSIDEAAPTEATLSRHSLRLLICIAGHDGIIEDALQGLSYHVGAACQDDADGAGGLGGLRAVLTSAPRATGEVQVMSLRDVIRTHIDTKRLPALAHLLGVGDDSLDGSQVSALDTQVPVRMMAPGLTLGRRRDHRTRRAYMEALKLASSDEERSILEEFVDVSVAVDRIRSTLESLAPQRTFEVRSLASFTPRALAARDNLAALGAKVAVVRDVAGAVHRVFVLTRASRSSLADALGVPASTLMTSPYKAEQILASTSADTQRDGRDDWDLLWEVANQGSPIALDWGP